MKKQQRKIFFSTGGRGIVGDMGVSVGIRRFTKKSSGRRIKACE
jgi:hypothetical protein